MPTRFLSAAAAFFLVFPALALHGQETVQLDFAWTPGAAVVTQSSTVSVTAAGQGNEVGSEMSYRLVVEEAAEGLHISFEDFSVDGRTMEEIMADPQAAGESGQNMASLAATQADFLVDRDGRFLRLADYEALRATLDEAIAPMRQQLDAQGMGGMMDEMLESLLTEEAVTLGAETNWNQTLGYWVGRTMTVGEPTAVTTTTVLPMLAGQALDVETDLVVVGRAACEAGGSEEACLELSARSEPDREELRNLMDIFMADILERSGGTGMEMAITGMIMESVTSLVVEAATLRPVRTETTVEISMAMDIMGMTQETQNRQVTVTRYDWGN